MSQVGEISNRAALLPEILDKKAVALKRFRLPKH
jgi:hypothetical protein